MSLQPQIQQQQPMEVYPSTMTSQPSPHHSNGSFGTVYVVLAVIIIISAIACCLGRLCNRGAQKPKHRSKTKPETKPKLKPNTRESFQPREDIEFGLEFDKRIPTPKPGGKGEGRGCRPYESVGFKGEKRLQPANDIEFKPGGKGGARGYRPYENVGFKGENRVQPMDDIEFKPGP